MKPANSRNEHSSNIPVPRAFLPVLTILLTAVLTIGAIALIGDPEQGWATTAVITAGAFLSSTIMMQQFKSELLASYQEFKQKSSSTVATKQVTTKASLSKQNNPQQAPRAPTIQNDGYRHCA